MGGACKTLGEMRNAYKILVGKSAGKRPLGRPSRRWECNIGMDVKEVGWEVVGWSHVAQNRDKWQTIVNTEMKLRFP
jgi:hypothetical protein